MLDTVTLTGAGLTPATVARVARHRAEVVVGAPARRRMAESRAVVDRHLVAGLPVYGLTTGLGSKVTVPLMAGAAAEFSRSTVRGRATAVGPPLPTDVVRAAIAIRVNQMARGGSGAQPAIVDGLLSLLAAGVHPIVPSAGSVGSGDICLFSHVALALIGEGRAELDGETMDAATALERAGLTPVELGAKDGLALISSSAPTAACAALALVDGHDVLAAAHVAAALSMEGFRANLTPIDRRVAAARPAPGQVATAATLRALLAGGELCRPGHARRLQDPLSLRCTSQVHGSLAWALELLEVAVVAELDGAGDNPLVITSDDEVVSTGNFALSALALATDTVALAVAQVANVTAERAGRLLAARLSDLPAGLSGRGDSGSGMGPLMKTAHALAGEIAHLAAPTCADNRISADGVEDVSTNATLGARRLSDMIARLRLLVAVELVVAAQAVDLASPITLGRGTAAAHAAVRSLVAPLDQDRPVSEDVTRVAEEALLNGRLLEAVARATGSRSGG